MRIMMFATLPVCLAGSLGVPAPAAAADALLPGLWDITVNIESFEGTAVTPQMKQALARQKPQTIKQCLSAEQLKPTADRLAIESKGKCKSTSFSMADGKLASAAECSGTDTTMKSTTSGTYTPKSYAFRSSNIVATSKGSVTTKTLMSGKWISACAK
jgi:Protein of unknown function (DUF3617)